MEVINIPNVVYISTCHDRKIEAMRRDARCFTLIEFLTATGI